MTRFDLLKRQFGFMAIGIMVAIGLLGAQTVGAMAPSPWQSAEASAVAYQGPAQVAFVPKFDNVKAWRAAGGIAYVQVTVEHALNVQLTMAGNISLKSHDSYNWGDVYEFYITGLTPDTLYGFQVAAFGAYTTVYYNGSVMT